MLIKRVSKSATIVFILLSYSAMVALYPSLNKIALYVALPVAFIITLLNFNDTKNCIKKYTGLLFSLYTLIAFSCVYAEYQDVALQHMRAVMGVVLLMIIIIMQSNNLKKIAILYGVYLLMYIAMWYYIHTEILSTIVFGQQRVDDSQLNANTIAYYTFYTTFALFVLGELVTNIKLVYLFKLLFIGTILLSIYVAIATASRQVLIIQVPLILLLMYIRYFKSGSTKTRSLLILSSVVVIAASSAYVLSTLENSYLMERTQNESIKDDPRTLLMIDAFNVGLDHFLTGVGAGNYICYSYSKHFSHCTYTELFANQGIIGLAVYVIMLFRFLFTQIKRYRRYKDDMFLIFGVFAFIFILDNVFYVFYPFLWLMGFLVLVMSHSEVYYKIKYERSN